MKVHRLKTAFVLVGCAVCVAMPFSVLYFNTTQSLISALSILAVVGWGLTLVFYCHHRNALAEMRSVLGTGGGGKEWDEEFREHLREFSRIYKAGFSMPLEKSVDADSLGRSLTQLAQLAQEEFRAQAVELSLFDESSGRRARSFLSGVPLASETQGMSTSELSSAHDVMSVQSPTGVVLRAPIRFAGNTFGEVRVELPEGVDATPADLKVLKLLAIQSSVLILNAEFTVEILKMRRSGEESVRAKTGFLATLSHEIRGPLGIILNGAELTLDGLCGEITPKTRDTLQMIKTSGEHLLDLVNDVLDYAKLEAGKVVPKTAELPLKPLLEDLMKVVRTQAHSKQHQLVLEPVDPSFGVVCDKRHARQMFINILTNAIKYTPEGGTITMRTSREDGRIKIAVSDTGVGIAANQRDRVFSPFERVEEQYSQSQQGTGLGMPLTKKLAEANGGSIDFDSTEGQGSTFWISLPEYDATGVIKSELGSGSYPRYEGDNLGHGETVLLVDPDIKARQMIETYLVHQGFQILTAETGKEVVRHLKDKTLDILILENDLPDLSGEEMVEALRNHPKAARLPIILLSAKAFVFDIEHFLKMGVDRCLSKPVDLKEVARTTRRLIDDSRKTNAH